MNREINISSIIVGTLSVLIGNFGVIRALSYIALDFNIVNPIVLIVTVTLTSILGHGFVMKRFGADKFKFHRALFYYVISFNIAAILNLILYMYFIAPLL